jgi:glucan 1,3-beta-glucosidase
VHQYVIFNTGQIVFPHKDKVTYACTGWTDQARQSMDVKTGFGPTIFAEWSQADTDCAMYLNNVGWGNRWEGTYDTGNSLTRVLSATCPTNNGGPTCSCAQANADPSQYSDSYKRFLKMFAEAQMKSFEEGWGWFYWTWKTENAAQWSYKKGLEVGILPSKAYAREFNCTQAISMFSDLPENY